MRWGIPQLWESELNLLIHFVQMFRSHRKNSSSLCSYVVVFFVSSVGSASFSIVKIGFLLLGVFIWRGPKQDVYSIRAKSDVHHQLEYILRFVMLHSFSFLWGPWNHIKHLLSCERLPFTAAYLGSIAGTLFSALWVSLHVLCMYIFHNMYCYVLSHTTCLLILHVRGFYDVVPKHTFLVKICLILMYGWPCFSTPSLHTNHGTGSSYCTVIVVVAQFT